MKLQNIINPKSLSGTGFISVLMTIFIIAPTIGSFWIFSEISQKDEELIRMKNQYTASYKTILFNDVNNVMNFIEYKRSNTRQRVEELVKERVQNAYSLASHIYSMDQYNSSKDQLKEKIIETLRPIRWNNGTGYFFMFNQDGVTVLNADRPSMETQDSSGLRDIDGKFVVKDMLDLAKSHDSGFYTYRWTKPGTKGADHEKITYVKNFKPFNWIICAGFYVADMETSIKEEILSRVSQLTDKKDQYIFVLKKDGFSLFHPLENYHRKNIINHRSHDGQLIIKELIEASQNPGGGYIEYPWEKPSSGEFEYKLSFAASVRDWGWTIGKGIYLDEVQQTIESEKNKFKKELQRKILIIIGFSILIILFSIGLGIVITTRLSKGIQAFTDFFQKAADADIKVDVKKLIFKEFKLLGTLANQMVEDRIEKEQALRRAMLETINLQNLLKNITDSMPSSLIAIDHDMKVIHWNRNIEKNTGIDAQNAEGQILENIFELSQKETALINETLRSGKPCNHTRVTQKTASKKQFEDMIIYPLITNHITGAVIRIDDTTEKVRIEEMMIQSEKMISVGGLAAGMAHEINNPLSGILGNIGVVKNRLLNDLPVNVKAAEQLDTRFENIKNYAEQRGLPQLIENIRQAGSRAAKIVSDMLGFSRMSSSNFMACSLIEIMDKTIDLASTSYDLKKKFDFKQIKIVRQYPPDMPQVVCESSKLQQVFLNILSNGAHAMADNDETCPPQFTITLCIDEDHAVISMADNGPGIPKEVSKRIFEPFFTTKEVGIGTGLGLSVSYFIITDHHKGTLEVESEMGKGTQFIIRIPLKP